MAAPEVVEIAPGGDVALICGYQAGKQVRIIASSAVLRLGSAVFKVLLGSRFREGALLAAENQVEVPLPDDNAKAMVTLCRLLHLHDILKDTPTTDEILALAILADKYDCRGALRPTYRVWIDYELQKNPTTDKLAKLFVASQNMDLSSTFGNIGMMLLRVSKGNVRLAAAGDCAKTLQHVEGSLNTQRKNFIRLIELHIENIIMREFDGRAELSEIHSCTRNCDYLWRRSSTLGRVLFTAPFWRLSSIESQSLQDLTSKLKTFKNDWAEPLQYCNGSRHLQCRGYALGAPAYIATWLKDLAKRIEDESIVLCLECVKVGHVQKTGGCDQKH